MATFQLFFSVQGTGGSPTGPDLENRVGNQDIGSPGRPDSSGLHVRINMEIDTTYVTLVIKAAIVDRGTLLTLVNQGKCGNPTNNGRVEKFGVNPIPYDGNK